MDAGVEADEEGEGRDYEARDGRKEGRKYRSELELDVVKDSSGSEGVGAVEWVKVWMTGRWMDDLRAGR